MTAPLWLRRLLRPLIPDRWMARRRIHEHSLGVRHNVDIVVADGSRAKLWLDTTPDTYRVRDPGQFGDAPSARFIDPAVGDEPAGDDDVVIVGRPLSEHLAETLTRPLSDPELAAVVLGEVPEPLLVDRRRVEPVPAPAAIAVRASVWHEIGGSPRGERPLPGLLERVRDAGHRLALIPATRAGSPVRRTDPIVGNATLVLSLVPLHDVGGGSRSAQLALALLRRGHHVTVVAVQPSSDADLGLRFVHPRLEQRTMTAFDHHDYMGRVGGSAPLVIAGVPAPQAVRDALALQAGGARLLYDCIDDWSSPWLGGDWYAEDAEGAVAKAADVVTVAAPDLAARIDGLFGATPVLVPNGVDQTVFTGDPGPVPPDFPPGSSPVIGYHGTLRAEWIDWTALLHLAEVNPRSRVVLIGEPPDPLPPAPPNLAFLGLKPHADLAAYVGRFDVGLVPFVLDAATHAASPLKVYEYLAAGVPVAAPPLRSLAGLDGVFTDPDLSAAAATALAAPPPDSGAARAEHSWDMRTVTLLTAAGLSVPAPEAPSARVVRRPTIHYPRHLRHGPKEGQRDARRRAKWRLRGRKTLR